MRQKSSLDTDLGTAMYFTAFLYHASGSFRCKSRDPLGFAYVPQQNVNKVAEVMRERRFSFSRQPIAENMSRQSVYPFIASCRQPSSAWGLNAPSVTHPNNTMDQSSQCIFDGLNE